MSDINLKTSLNEKHFSKPLEVSTVTRNGVDKEKLAKASRDFESMLTSMMLKSMTKTTPGMFGGEEGFGGNYLEGMFEMHMADHMTNKGGLGLAEQIYRKITGEDLPQGLGTKNVETFAKIKKEKISEEFLAVKPSEATLKRVNKYDKIIESAAKEYNIDPNFVKSVISAESAGNVKALSKAKAKGLMQLMDPTAKDMGVKNVWDPTQNIYGGTKYLSKMLNKYDGDKKLALAAYNAGPGNVDKYNGIPPFEETQTYVNRVMGYYQYLEG